MDLDLTTSMDQNTKVNKWGWNGRSEVRRPTALAEDSGSVPGTPRTDCSGLPYPLLTFQGS